MKKVFEMPDFEVVRFENDDIVATSSCCDVAGTVMDDDDEACGSGDSECMCGSDTTVNCV